MTTYLLCCDWGTSFFRLRLMSQLTFECIAEVSSQSGIAGTFEGWKTAAKRIGVSRDDFFRQQLKTQIDLLATKTSIRLAGIPMVLSGMASSSIGMAEVPYATLPFAVDGSQASIRHFTTQTGFPHEILLISGVRSLQDVMRGEETQLTGLIALLDLPVHEAGEAIFIFPGTHSKHMYIREGQLLNFDTYMTGELFDLMATQSILNASVDISNLSTLARPDLVAFKQGVGAAQSSTLLNRLFTVRTNQLFDKLTRKQNALYLSGLLIGSELKNLQENEKAKIVLCSGSSLSRFYTLAMETVGLTKRTVVVPPELIDQAASVGQILLFQNQTVKETTK
ncbi:MAG: 2-keto-3-deoxy-galactonokinase [Spirosoma sp.]|nr:2-keto-3-deoxy-galactonokinase [Spirosoma sp.]